jgi:peptidoglycan/LPS O-acetylase OafA/YrhL
MHGFRPDIQGLRAVAVLLVLGYHLWPGAVTGGFVGVDVFFVLSGFLITSHLRDEHARTGAIALRQFWARRIRRLLPAASVVLVVSLLLMVLVLPQALWERTVTEIGASAVYAQNWVLMAQSVDYLAAENVPTLVQHFWSLSVEEQFYLVWPLLFLLCAKRPRLAIGVVLVASLVWWVLGASYFDTLGRAWEFAAGALLALVPLRVPRALSYLGVAMILLGGVFWGDLTALPVVGALLVIAAGSSALLSIRPLTFVGDVSYGVYLWHWPLLIAAPFVFGAVLPDTVLVGIVVVSVVLAWIMKRLVEDPLRFTPALRQPRRAFALAATLVAALVVTSGASVAGIGASTAAAARQSLIDFETKPCYGAAALVEDCAAPFAVPSGLVSAFAPVDKGSLAQPCSAPDAEVVRCEFGTRDHPTRTVALIGNSHAGALVAGFEEYAQDAGWTIVLLRKTGCVGASTSAWTTAYDPTCTAWTRAVLDLVATDEFDAVVFATNNDSAKYLGARDAPTDELLANIETNLATLAAAKPVLAIGDVPATPEPAPACVDQNHLRYDPCATPRQDGMEHGNLVAEAARAVPGVASFSLLPYFCDATQCHVMIGGVVVYIDEHHLSASYSRSLGPYLGAALEPLLP